ncbi:MAG: hypothetical protein JW934_03170 [Anaerolineae bacterium]|nr:hypothetical protein [Anaerolineae bacterium]
MKNNNGFLNFIGLVALLIGLYIWVNNVNTITIVEQLPPPQDSWDIVYPRFRDEVSAQLLNTQLLVGSVLSSTSHIKTQNADLQYSMDLLLDNVGVMKTESYRESTRQRDEQRILTIASVLFGWLLGAFVTKDSIEAIRKRLALPRKKSNSKAVRSNDTRVESDQRAKSSLQEHIKVSPDVKGQPVVYDPRLQQSKQTPSAELCPICGKPMGIRTSPRGKRLLVCPNFQQCRQVSPID